MMRSEVGMSRSRGRKGKRMLKFKGKKALGVFSAEKRLVGSEGEEEAKDEEDDQCVRCGEESVIIPKTARRPRVPTQKEREEHNATHLPYQSWCEHCVAGRGVSSPHKSTKDGSEDEEAGTTIGMDYCFATTEEKDKDIGGTLVMYDEDSTSLWAIQVEHKGAVENVINWCATKLDENGYRGCRVSLKSTVSRLLWRCRLPLP